MLNNKIGQNSEQKNKVIFRPKLLPTMSKERAWRSRENLEGPLEELGLLIHQELQVPRHPHLLLSEIKKISLAFLYRQLFFFRKERKRIKFTLYSNTNEVYWKFNYAINMKVPM